MSKRSAASCSVTWCCALAMKNDERCAVHVAVPEFKPLDVFMGIDWWGDQSDDELQDEPPQLPNTEPRACTNCDGKGDCQCCDGNGYISCHARNCRHSHDCHSCDGDGKCLKCNGAGVLDEKGKPFANAGDPKQTKQWFENRPSVKRAA